MKLQTVACLSALVLFAAGCSGCSSVLSSNNGTQQTIASLEVGLASAEYAAAAYVKLPVCVGTTPVCSDPALSAKLKAADNRAYAAIKTAEGIAAAGGSVSTVAASAALVAFQGLIPTGAKP